MENLAERSFQSHGHGVRETMGNVHQLRAERSDREALSRCYLDELDVVQELVLVQPFSDHRDRQLGAVDGNAEPLCHVRESTDMVFVRVGDDDSLERLPVLVHIAGVGKDEVHARVLVAGKHDAGVHDDHRVVHPVGHHVHPELAQPAERNDIERATGGALDRFHH